MLEQAVPGELQLLSKVHIGEVHGGLVSSGEGAHSGAGAEGEESSP